LKGKILVIVALALGATLVFLAGASYGASTIRLIVNGKDIATDVPPFIQNSRTFVPIRFVAEALGYPVSYDGNTKTVYVGIPPEGVDLSPYEFGGKSFSISNPCIIGGVKYSRGFSINQWGSAFFNLSGHYSTVTLSLGHQDGDARDKQSKIIAYGDGEEIASFDVSKSDLLKDFTIGVSGVKQLKITITSGWGSIAVINARGKK